MNQQFKQAFEKIARISSGAKNLGRVTRVLDIKPWAGGFGKFVDKIRYGADDVLYSPSSLRVPKTPKKIKGTVVHQQEWHANVAKGDRNIGSSQGAGYRALGENKKKELQLLNRSGALGDTKTLFPGEKFKGKKGLQKLQAQFKGNFFLKPSEGFASGVGGVGFLNSKDIKAFLGGEKLSPKKQEMISNFLRNPKKFIAQQDMRIDKNIFGQGKEFRVHAVGNKVVPGASSPREGNLVSYLTSDQGKAEKALQKVLNKLPKKYKDMGVAADVAKTKGGKFKVIELNAGTMSSGLLDPVFLQKTYKGPAGFFAGLEATRKNWNVYKSLTGKMHPAEKALKATTAAGVVGGAGTIAYNQSKNRNSKKRE